MTISAVVTAHKDRNQLLTCLKNLKKQTKQPDEVILFVSDMPINFLEANIIVKDINRNDWGHNKRDIGLRLATKDYIVFINADDEYHVEFLEKLSQHTEDLIYCDFESHLAGRIIESYPSMGTITSGNFIIKRELAQKVGWKHRDYLADGKFIMEIMEQQPTYVRVPEVLYYHR